MSVSNAFSQIMIGDEVFGSDAAKLGKVAEIYPGFITVEKGFFFPTNYFIPRTAVQETTDGQVYLTVTKDDALRSGWDQPPASFETAQDMTSGVVTDDELLGMRQASVLEGRDVATTQMADRDEIRIPLVIDEDRRADQVNP